MKTLIAHASIDEKGKAAGGKSGDQSGREVCIREWYSKPWDYVIRINDLIMRNRIARAMELAAGNAYIGYDQAQRNTLLAYARNVGYDPGQVTTPCETDCSALVALACMYAGIPERKLTINGNSATTRTLRSMLWNTGMVDIFDTKDYTAEKRLLMRGDILLKEGSHVVVVVQTEYEPTHKDTDIHAVAKDVLAGKWGNGATRISRLIAAGYDYYEVQAEVNRIIKEGLR